MAHGSGGNATKQLIKELFQKYLANQYLDKMEDSAVLPSTEYPLALTTDSFVITPLEFPGGDIGKLAICGTVNDLWMAGAQPQYLTAGFIMEEGLEIGLLERIVKSFADTANEAGIQIVAGDTKVVQGDGGLYINTAGLGFKKTLIPLGIDSISKGDAVIVSGCLGNHQACIMSHRMEITNSITSDCANLGLMVQDLLTDNLGIKVMRDITRGGLATVLNEIAESSGTTIEIEETSIPVDPEVDSFCNILGLDPLYMANEGKFLCIAAEDHEDEILARLTRHPLGTNSRIIGRVTDLNKYIVTVKTRLGGRRIIDILYGEGLPRIC